MLMRICAVIVTYNRSESLVRCVSAVLNQLRRPDAVIVVDNGSYVPAVDVLRQCTKELQIFRFPENTGGAGGFHFGMAETFRQGFDAVWLMDDDGLPSKSCLANLVDAMNKTEIGFANPLVVNEKTPENLAFGLAISGRTVWSTEEALGAVNSDGVIEGTISPFNGSLITREAYRVLGDIKFECFIWGDEVEYSQRALASNVGVGTVASAVHYHPEAKSNTVEFGQKIKLQVCPPDRSHFYFRNLGFYKSRYRGIAIAGYWGLIYLYFLLRSGHLAEALKFVCYYTDGVLNSYTLQPSRSRLIQILTQVVRVEPISKMANK
jgi:rhamnopyranosyl-N-acetylglucosaminyl-diphospho-decaprenol beta-1,3/1,4-galactofuranosyltransferase